MDKNEYRKKLKAAIENAKGKAYVTIIMQELGISRGNISGFLAGDDNRLSIKKIEALIERLEDKDANISNQQKLASYSPKKAANVLANAFFDFSGVKLTPGKKNEFSKEIEDWLKSVRDSSYSDRFGTKK